MSNQTWEEMLAAQREEQRHKAEKLQELIAQGGLKEWADKLTAEGKELRMTWDGGGDSGWVDFLIDDKEPAEGIDADNAELLRDMCYSELDYGSWAGEFSATGEAVYNPEASAFVGTDYYSEDEQEDCNKQITVTIPSDIWFDRLDITVQDEEINIQTDFIIRNGFNFPDKTQIEQNLTDDLESKFREAVDEFIKETGHEYRSVWEEISLPFTAFTDMGNGTRQAVIDGFSVGTYNSSEKDIIINVKNEEEEDEE